MWNEVNPLDDKDLNYYKEKIKEIWIHKKEEIISGWFMYREGKIKVDILNENEIIYSSPQPYPKGEGVKSLDDFEWFDSEWNWKINPEILKKVIKDDSWNYYRIIKMEYDFLVKYWLPLPRLHWLDRMKVNFGV